MRHSNNQQIDYSTIREKRTFEKIDNTIEKKKRLCFEIETEPTKRRNSIEKMGISK